MLRTLARRSMPAILLLAVACGGGGNQDSGVTQPTSGAPSSAQTAVATSAPTAAPTAEPTTAPTQAATAAATAPSASPTGSTEGQVQNPQEEQALLAAQQVLAKQTNTAPEEMQLVSITAREWPDSSLGCPKPGMMYTQVITPGYLVVLDAGGKQYNVHTDSGGRAVVCQLGQGSATDAPSRDSLVSITRSGGFAGMVMTLVARPDGTVQLINGDEAAGDVLTTLRLEKPQVEQIRAAVESPQWQSLESQYGKPAPDRYQYTVSAGGKQVTVYEGATMPQPLQEVLRSLGAFWTVS